MKCNIGRCVKNQAIIYICTDIQRVYIPRGSGIYEFIHRVLWFKTKSNPGHLTIHRRCRHELRSLENESRNQGSIEDQHDLGIIYSSLTVSSSDEHRQALDLKARNPVSYLDTAESRRQRPLPAKSNRKGDVLKVCLPTLDEKTDRPLIGKLSAGKYSLKAVALGTLY